MTGRFVAFLLCLAGGGLVGWWLSRDRGAELGLVAGSVAWFTLETLRGARVLRWLRRGDLGERPKVGGLWGEAVNRVHRAVALRDKRSDDAERRLAAFMEAIQRSPNGVVLLDPRGRIQWCNETAAAHYGIDPTRDLEQHIVNLVRDPDVTALFSSRSNGDDVVVAAPGSSAARPRRLALRLHPYGEGRILLLSRDVTAMEQAETMRRDFVANVSHEIRTPLTVLSGFVETLQNLPLPPTEQQRYLDMMAQQAQRMQTLVNDLLTLSRLEGSPMPAASEWTPLAPLLTQCEQEARTVARSLGKALELAVRPAPAVTIAGASTELLSAFSNLITNAVRYTPAGGSVTVDTTIEDDGRLQMAVRDTGPGIAAEHLPRLTERFYRVDRSRSRDTGGTGLGLAIVKHVVQRHGGELRIESTPGVGSIFTILLPPARVRPVAVTPSGTVARPATESAAG